MKRSGNRTRCVATVGNCGISGALSNGTMASGSEPIMRKPRPWCGMADQCPRCQGILNQQWDVFLRQHEAHCLTCGNLPGVKIRREDGRELNAPRYCRSCCVRPVMLVQGSSWSRVTGQKELTFCAVCREKVNRQWRMKACVRREQAGGKLS